MLTKLRQIASRAKIEPFMEQLVSAVDGGHKILVFSQFVKTLKLVAERLDAQGIRYCYLDGSTKDRLGECEKFNRTGGQVDGEVLLSTDVKLMRQLEASFCLAREVDKKGEILIDPNDPTHGGKVCAAASSGR
jgi:hypothetical protein